jgi:hypothetical protein
MSIHNVLTKINPKRIWLQIGEKTRLDIVFLLILVLVGGVSFAFGKLSTVEATKEAIVIEMPELSMVPTSPTTSAAKPANTSTTQSAGIVYASKQGKKYHFPHCPGAKTISAKNKISFQSPELAKSAGYTQASNCK